MVKNSIHYTWDAINDLDSIFDYISEENQAAAAKLLEQIEKAILYLEDNPRMGTVVVADDLFSADMSYRKLVVKPYIIFYRIDGNEINVLRVLHSRQNWLHLLFGMQIFV